MVARRRARARSVGHPRREEGPIYPQLFCSGQRSSGTAVFSITSTSTSTSTISNFGILAKTMGPGGELLAAPSRSCHRWLVERLFDLSAEGVASNAPPSNSAMERSASAWLMAFPPAPRLGRSLALPWRRNFRMHAIYEAVRRIDDDLV